jgi:transcriptional regulator with XRE-family HTH domain
MNNKANGSKSVDDAVNEVVKTKNKSNKAITFGDNGFDLLPGDNSKTLSDMMYIYNLPKIDINDDQEVEERIQHYFNYCISKDIKPGVEGLAMAIGVSRATLWDWESGRSRMMSGSSRSDMIKKAKQFLALYMENLSQNGKINPITAIFLMKNHFGYADKQEVVITPNQNLEAAQTPEQIAEQIACDIPLDL